MLHSEGQISLEELLKLEILSQRRLLEGIVRIWALTLAALVVTG